MNITEKSDPNPLAQYSDVILENMTKDPFAHPTGILGYTDFLQEDYGWHPPPQAYTVYALNQIVQTNPSKTYLDTFEVHDKDSPINYYPSNTGSIYEDTQVSRKAPPDFSSRNILLDQKYQSFLQNFSFT